MTRSSERHFCSARYWSAANERRVTNSARSDSASSASISFRFPEHAEEDVHRLPGRFEQSWATSAIAEGLKLRCVRVDATVSSILPRSPPYETRRSPIPSGSCRQHRGAAAHGRGCGRLWHPARAAS